MFLIKRVGDQRLARRICESFGAQSEGAVVYGAFRDDEVLATAILRVDGDCMTLEQADTGRRLDVDLVDGIARAAFFAGTRKGVKRARLGESLSGDLRLALTKLGYEMHGPFGLDEFFAKKNCGKKG